MIEEEEKAIEMNANDIGMSSRKNRKAPSEQMNRVHVVLNDTEVQEP